MRFFAFFAFFAFYVFCVKAQTNNLFKWKGGSSSGNGPTSWNVNANWEVWDSGSSTWISNVSTDIPNSTTHTVVVDFSSAVTKTLSLDVNADISQIDVINNGVQPCAFVIEYNKKLSVYNTYSVSGTNVNLINISCPSPIGGPGFGANLFGGGTIDFKPTMGTTINPIFSTCTYTNIAIKVSGQGTTNFAENNLSFQSFLHELGNFNLNNLSINLKCAFMLDPVNLTSDGGNISLLGSSINTQNVILSTTALYNFSTETTTINLNGANTTSQFCEFSYKGNNLATSTSSVSAINIIGGKQVFFTSNFPSSCSKNVVINNLTTSQDLIFDAASSVTEYHIKNWNLTKPLVIKNINSLVSFKSIESIITAPSSCNVAYSFLSTPDQVNINTLMPVTVTNMAFHNVKVASGSVTANNCVDIGYNSGIVFNTALTSFGATTLTWNGSSDTKWDNALNWTPNCVPTILTNVIIPSGTLNSPEIINSSGMCYHFNTVGSPTVTIGVRSSLNIGGDFIRTSGAVIKPTSNTLYAQMYINLLGVLPNTTYNITSANSNLFGCHLSIFANSNNTWYSLADDFSVNYPSVNNFSGLILYSGGLLTNSNGISAGAFQLLQSNVATTSTRSLNIANSVVRLSDYNVGHSFYLHCPNTNVFNTTNSTIYFDKNLDAASDFNITVYGLPTNNHLATPSFSLNRVVFNNQPTLPSVITLYDAQPNLTPQSGFKIKSLNTKGNVVINSNGYNNLLNIDSLYVLPGYNLIGQANSSITINNYISSASNCQSSPFFIKSSTPSSLASNQFYISTGSTITYTLNNWNIDAVRINQNTGGSPAISIENSILSGNTGITPSNGWNTSVASSKVFYWIGEGATTNWTDLDNWSFVIPTNGDDPTAGCLPSVLDDVIFTNLSFYGNTGSTVNTTSVVTVNQSVFFKDMRWLGPFNTTMLGSTALYPIITNTNSTTEINAYGSICMHKTMKWDFGNTSNNLNNVNFFSTLNDTIEVQNNSFNGDLYFLGTGRYVIQDSLVLCSVTKSSYNTGINKGTIYHYKGELDALGHKIFACAYNSLNNLPDPRKLNINNSKLYFIQIGPLGGGICIGNYVANSYTLNATNSIIDIKPYDDYCYTCSGAYNTVLNLVTDPISSEPRLSFNKINITSYSQANTGYYVNNIGKGVDIDSLSFDVLKTHFLNTVTTETNNINYLKYKVSSTNVLTSQATTSLKELDANGACDPLIIQSSIVGNYANLCPTTTPLEANSASLKYINSACGAYVSPNYSMLKGTLASFIPTGSENTYGWTIDPTSISLGFKGQNTATISCGGFPHTINTTGFNISVSTHTLIWNTPSGTYIGTPTNGLDLTTFTTNAVGVHSLTVYYTPNCYVTDTYTVNLINSVTSVISTSNVICNSSSTGAYSITATTGTLSNSTYSYIITPTYTTSFANTLNAGVYSYTVSDLINPSVCFTTNTFVITEPTQLTSTVTITNSVTCFGATNASVTSIVSGGTGGYNFNWTNGLNTYTNQNLNNIGAGSYSLIITDANNCVASNTVIVNEPTSLPLITDLIVTNASCGNSNASVTYSANGGSPSYQFVFTATNTAQSFTTTSTTASSLSSGTYTLLIIDANTCNTFTVFTIINNTVVPVCDFSVTNACINNTIAVNNISSVANGSIISYAWNFGQNASPVITSSLQTPTPISYSVSGTQSISLNISTSDGCVAQTTKTITIYTMPSAIFASDSVCLNLATTLNSTSNGNGNPITNYGWDFNNDAVVDATTITATHTFTNYGNTLVHFTVSTSPSSGITCKHDTTINVWVHPLPQPSFIYTNNCVNAQPNNFDAYSSVIAIGSNTLFTWGFGDNNTSSGSNQIMNHTYINAGIYSVSLTATSNKGCVAAITNTVEIYQKPIISILATSNVCLGSSTSFTATTATNSGNVVNYQWDLNNFIPSIEAMGVNSSYNFGTTGTHTITVLTITDHFCKDTTTRTVYINYIPTADFIIDNPSGCEAHCVTFTDMSTNVPPPAKIIEWAWNFGNGKTNTVSNNTSQIECYTNPIPNTVSEYNAGLIIKTDSGCVASVTYTNLIKIYPKPLANYEIIPELGNIIEPKAAFNNLSQGFNQWSWNFGDGSLLNNTELNPQHYYKGIAGQTYYTELIVINQYGCSDTAYKVFELSPEFVFYIPNTFSPNSDKTNEIFSGVGIGITKYEMWIYDRWGEQIYYTDDINKGWNGRKQGAEVDSKQDIYVWKVELKDVFGKKHNYVGHVTLLR